MSIDDFINQTRAIVNDVNTEWVIMDNTTDNDFIACHTPLVETKVSHTALIPFDVDKELRYFRNVLENINTTPEIMAEYDTLIESYKQKGALFKYYALSFILFIVEMDGSLHTVSALQHTAEDVCDTVRVGDIGSAHKANGNIANCLLDNIAMSDGATVPYLSNILDARTFEWHYEPTVNDSEVTHPLRTIDELKTLFTTPDEVNQKWNKIKQDSIEIVNEILTTQYTIKWYYISGTAYGVIENHGCLILMENDKTCTQTH